MAAGLAFLSILGALAVGVVSPGPSFVLVARTAVAVSRGDAVAAALGMGLGGVAFAALALLGLHALLAQVGWAYDGLKLAGALYLIYLACRLWRGATTPLAMTTAALPRRGGLRRSFTVGLATQLSNPKTAIVYGGVFAALLPASPPLGLLVALLPAIFLLETGWYVIVALIFSGERPRAAYGSCKRWLDRLAGVVMGALGARLIVETVRFR
jgi:threonine/homoserine/homoserine lactone efflux protein